MYVAMVKKCKLYSLPVELIYYSDIRDHCHYYLAKWWGVPPRKDHSGLLRAFKLLKEIRANPPRSASAAFPFY